MGIGETEFRECLQVNREINCSRHTDVHYYVEYTLSSKVFRHIFCGFDSPFSPYNADGKRSFDDALSFQLQNRTQSDLNTQRKNTEKLQKYTSFSIFTCFSLCCF